MKIARDVIYVGVNDHQVDLFEGMYKVPNGMSYNSYVILDEKIAVMDTVDKHFTEQWLGNLEQALQGKTPDYLVVQHMEPDHSASITAFTEKYPQAVVVANDKAFVMVDNFFGKSACPNRLSVSNGQTLDLGKHSLTFVFAPMVHWPEVMVTYDQTAKILFSADALGKFGALDVEDDDWACEARRYYFGIVGKYGVPAQNLLKAAKNLDIQTICPLHGPVLSENLGYYLDLYNTWSSYGVETEGVCLCYTSVYGHTEQAALLLADELRKNGVKVAVNDLARCDMAEAVEDAFRYGKLVLATTTYAGTVFPFMREFLANITERGYQNRTVALIENGSWAPTAAKVMRSAFEKCKNVTVLPDDITILSAMTEQNKLQIADLAKALAE